MHTFLTPNQLKSFGAVAEALESAASQLNSCSVALSDLGVPSESHAPGTLMGLLLASYCDVIDAKRKVQALAAEQVPA